MIITVDPTQSEDIAAFAMVKQYRLQALNVTLNGGTGAGAWQAVQSGEGYTQTVVTSVAGIELVYEDPNAIVSYTVENDDTSNYKVASDAGIILSSIEPTDNAWTYTCVFHADSVPVSSVDIDLLVYGNVARGTEQQGSSATAEEITAQVLAGLETRVTALEEEMPDKVDTLSTTGLHAYTHNGSTQGDTEIVDGTTAATIPIRDANGRMQAADPASGATNKTLATTNWISQTSAGVNNLVHKNSRETIDGRKDFISYIGPVIMANNIDVNTTPSSNQFKPFILLRDVNDTEMVTGYFFQSTTGVQGMDLDIVREGTLRCRLHFQIESDGGALMNFQTPKGTVTLADTR